MLKAIILIGLPGAGKSATGQALARLLGWKFLDSDQTIQEQSGQSIADIFKIHGEAHFRSLETAFLDDLTSSTSTAGIVLATGGGLPVSPGNFEKLSAWGKVVYLSCNMDSLTQRLKTDDNRPLLQHDFATNSQAATDEVKTRLSALLDKRQAIYNRASLIIDTTAVTPEMVAEEILTLLGLKV